MHLKNHYKCLYIYMWKKDNDVEQRTISKNIYVFYCYYILVSTMCFYSNYKYLLCLVYDKSLCPQSNRKSEINRISVLVQYHIRSRQLFRDYRQIHIISQAMVKSLYPSNRVNITDNKICFDLFYITNKVHKTHLSDYLFRKSFQNSLLLCNLSTPKW